MAHNHGTADGSSNYSTAALSRNYHGCDPCHKDRKKCEGGVPCSRCTRLGKLCVSGGRSQRENLNRLVSETYGPNTLLARNIDRDGYYAIYSPRDGFTYYQELSQFYVPVAPAIRIAYEYNLDVANVPYNVDFTVDELLNAGRGPLR